MRACVRAYVRACMCVRACVCVCVCVMFFVFISIKTHAISGSKIYEIYPAEVKIPNLLTDMLGMVVLYG